MKNEHWILAGVTVLLTLAGLLFLLYRRLYDGRPQLGLHLQIAALLVACSAVLLAVVVDRVEIGAGGVLLGFVVGIAGMFIHASSNRRFDEDGSS